MTTHIPEYTPGSFSLAISSPCPNHRSGFHSCALSPQIRGSRFAAPIPIITLVLALRWIEVTWVSVEVEEVTGIGVENGSVMSFLVL